MPINWEFYVVFEGIFSLFEKRGFTDFLKLEYSDLTSIAPVLHYVAQVLNLDIEAWENDPSRF